MHLPLPCRLSALGLLPLALLVQAQTPAAYKVGDAVQIQWKSSWYPGRVLEAKNGSYKIHYDGYAASWDEWVAPARLKAASAAAPVPKPTPAVPSAKPLPATKTSAAGKDGPPVGKYLCYTTAANMLVGSMWIMPGGQYKILEAGPVGTYRFDARTRELTWASGSNLRLKRRGWYAGPTDKDDIRSESNQNRHTILYLEEGATGSPYDNQREGETNFIRCYCQDQ
ncbi:MBT domain-containing protein [Hymenobacter latericus]|uniref:hypothetical protein n=1 Tax=Hymenobacter sp. YIM 151858-1 TaxID=2987688 RepID=UPI002227018E|nr:hypothetical protein [Hymenobacter sp. YIM 151858-1]UYZ57846.1 hypothetical protein OIS50_12335 [Hymenobacter sp. YIM 151858-1]